MKPLGPPPQSLRERARLTLSYLRALPRVFQLVKDSSRSFAVGIIALMIGQAVIPAAMAWVGKLIVDAVVDASRTGSRADERRVVEYVLVEFGLMVVSTIL